VASDLERVDSLMDSIIETVFHHAQRYPARPALFFEGQEMSYGQLFAEAEDFARALIVWGLQPGDRVALFLDNSLAFALAYLGTQRAAGIVVLVNTQYRQVELSHIMTDAGVRLCVTNPAGREELSRLDGPTLTTLVIVDDTNVSSVESPGKIPCGGASTPGVNGCVEAPSQGIFPESIAFETFLTSGSGSDVPLPPMPAPEAPAVIGYTSGTTGRAKGALLCQRNLTANIMAVTTAWHWQEDDRLLLALPLFHAHGLMVGLHGTLFMGASAILRRKFDAADVLATFEADPSVTLFFGVPTMYARLLAEAERRGVPKHLPRLFVSGSAPLSPQAFADFKRVFGHTILERYGMTETIMNLTNPYEGERRPGTVGGPFPGQQARVVDVHTRLPLPPGEIGEIEVYGPHVFVGYWNRPEATAEAFSADGWFKTGDLGWCSADGYYTITGRARELIISGGYNIYPREIENVLETHPAVAEVAVIGLPDAEFGEQVIAAVVPKKQHTIDAGDIINFCRERLASYKKPRQVIFVDTLPRNVLGKVQKHLLVAQLRPSG
jgi:malonyl-CoA/methylmalonyl-CoA synthetase